MNPTKEAGHFRILSMVYCSLFTIIIALCSYITIPTVIPFTLQTLGVFITLELLGGKKGTSSFDNRCAVWYSSWCNRRSRILRFSRWHRCAFKQYRRIYRRLCFVGTDLLVIYYTSRPTSLRKNHRYDTRPCSLLFIWNHLVSFCLFWHKKHVRNDSGSTNLYSSLHHSGHCQNVLIHRF